MSTVANRITIKRLHPHFVAKVAGIDCSAPVLPEDFGAIWEAFNEHQILVFRDQHCNDESQIAFGSKFNELPSPLIRLQTLRADLVSFSDYAAACHRETSGGYLRQEVGDAELLPFARGALGVIQARSFRP